MIFKWFQLQACNYHCSMDRRDDSFTTVSKDVPFYIFLPYERAIGIFLYERRFSARGLFGSRMERVWPEEFDQKSLSCLPQRARVITVQAMWIIGKRRTHVCCTPSPRARVCVFLLYSLTNVPYRCLAVYCISNAANALRYTEFPFRVNPTGERNPCTYLELSLKKKEKKKKRRETSIHPPRLLLHHLCTLLPRATDKSRQIWEKTQK